MNERAEGVRPVGALLNNLLSGRDPIARSISKASHQSS